MSTRIQLRRGTAAQWTATNPVLADGEPGLERDTHKVKVGDGVTPWAGLPYAIDPSGLLAAAGYTDAAVAAETAARQSADATLVPLTQKGAPGGVASLGVDGKVPSAQIPSLQWVRSHPVANQTAMLALTGVVAGEDIAIRQDGAGTFLFTGADPTQLASWTLLVAPTDAVTTVNGHTGAVVLSAPDVGADASGAAATAQTAAQTYADNAAAARAKPRGAWQATTVYAVNDVVTNAGGAFRCLIAHTSGATFPGAGATWEAWNSGAPTAALITVNHGSDASTVRPSGAAQVLWIGTVVPNGVTDDLWEDKSTSPAVLRRHNGTSFEALTSTGSGNPTPTVSNLSYPIVMGHRGAANLFPENTIEALEGADALGVRIVKFDVMGTADGGQILMHDTTMDRTTDATGTITSMTVAGVKRANVASSKFFAAKFPTLKVPTLQEVLDRLVYSNLVLCIEPKVAGANQINKIAAAAGARGVKSKILIGTTVGGDIAAAVSNGMQGLFFTQVADPVTTTPPATVVGYGATHISIRYSSLTANLAATIAAYKAVGLRVTFWTIDRQPDYDAVIAAGADGVLSNDPLYVSRQYSNYRTLRTTWDLDGTWPAGIQTGGAQVSGNAQNNGSTGRGDVVGQPGGYRLSVPIGSAACIGQVSPVANAASSYTLTFVFDFDTIGTALSFLGFCFALSSDNMNDTAANGVLKTGYVATIRQNGQLVLWSSNGTTSSVSLGTATTTVPQVISLTSTLTAGAAVTSIPVQALTVAMKVGHQVKLPDGLVATLTSAAAIGATALAVTSVTPTKTITSAVVLAAGPTASTTIVALQVQPLATTLLDGQLLNLGNGQVATVVGDQPVGATNIPIASLALNSTAISAGAVLYTVLPVRATIVVTVSPTTVTAQRGDETSVGAISAANTDWRGGYVALRNNLSQSSGMGVNTAESITVS